MISASKFCACAIRTRNVGCPDADPIRTPDWRSRPRRRAATKATVSDDIRRQRQRRRRPGQFDDNDDVGRTSSTPKTDAMTTDPQSGRATSKSESNQPPVKPAPGPILPRRARKPAPRASDTGGRASSEQIAAVRHEQSERLRRVQLQLRDRRRRLVSDRGVPDKSATHVPATACNTADVLFMLTFFLAFYELTMFYWLSGMFSSCRWTIFVF